MGFCNSTSLIHQADLLVSCYRMAGHLVMMECAGAGAGGWLLVWKNHDTEAGGIAYPSMASACKASAEWQAIIAMGGVAAESLQLGQQLDADQLVKAAQVERCFLQPPEVLEAAPDVAAFTLAEVEAQWKVIESYAQRVIEQWADPLALEQFRIDRLYPDGKQADGGGGGLSTSCQRAHQGS